MMDRHSSMFNSDRVDLPGGHTIMSNVSTHIVAFELMFKKREEKKKSL